ncbi:MAG: DUF4321 domain-containing protein [Peptococcia bacterium]
MKGYSAPRSPWLLLILLIVGGLLGSLIGTALGSYLPILNEGFQPVGFAPTTFDLLVVTITLGLTFKFNVASAVGFLLAVFIFFKL